MRRAAKVDANQSELIKAFRQMGVSVVSLAAHGKGLPDLLLSYQGYTHLAEVKMPKGKLTDDQERFKAGWQGCISIVRDLEGVETVVRFMKAMAGRLK